MIKSTTIIFILFFAILFGLEKKVRRAFAHLFFFVQVQRNLRHSEPLDSTDMAFDLIRIH